MRGFHVNNILARDPIVNESGNVRLSEVPSSFGFRAFPSLVVLLRFDEM